MNDCDGMKTTRQKKDSCGTTRNESPFARFFGNALSNARMMRGMTQEQFAMNLEYLNTQSELMSREGDFQSTKRSTRFVKRLVLRPNIYSVSAL